MVRYTVLIPQCNRADDVRRQLPVLVDVMQRFDASHEIVVVDDGSNAANQQTLGAAIDGVPNLRLLRLETACGASVALGAGIAAARGEMVIAIEPGEAYNAEQIPWLVSWLARADMVAGRRPRSGWAKFWQRFARIPRWLLLGLESHDPDCLFWAARREVLGNLQLTPGMCRYLPAIVSQRGYRVCDAYVEHRGPMRWLQDVGPNPGDLLAAWWICRRWREPQGREVHRVHLQPALRLHWREDAEQLDAAPESAAQGAATEPSIAFPPARSA